MTNEARYYFALKRIAAYMPPEALKRKAEKLYCLTPNEALEMAYENIQSEAKVALGRRKPPKEGH